MSDFSDWALLALVGLSLLGIAFFCWCMFDIEDVNPHSDEHECPTCKKPTKGGH